MTPHTNVIASVAKQSQYKRNKILDNLCIYSYNVFMTDDIDTPNTPEDTGETPPTKPTPQLTPFQQLMVDKGHRKPPEPETPALTDGIIDPNVLGLPNNLTAASIAKMTESLDPDHPAAQLGAMNAKLLSLMMVEDDQSCMLRRQAQTLDTLFHTMLGFGMESAKRQKVSPRKDNIALALQSQRQCFDTVKSLKSAEYTDAHRELVLSKAHTRESTRQKTRANTHANKRIPPPSPHVSTEQTIDGG